MARIWALLAAGAAVLVAAGAAVLVAATAGVPVHRPAETARHRALPPGPRVTLAGGCPYRLGTVADLRNSGGGLADRFVPRAPSGGLICRYGSGAGARYRSVRLGRDAARRVADRLDRIPPGVTAAPHGCPMDTGTATVLVFGYPHRTDVDVWYHDSGCAWIDNGTLRADALARPSFYAGFVPAVDRLAPPAATRP